MDPATTPATARRAPRRDAQRRRAALVAAAAACFREQGYGVPLEAVADRAGVGRGTLYRNFPDRGALALAIFSDALDRLEATIDPAAPIEATIAALVRDGAAAVTLFGRIAFDLQADDPNLDAFRGLGARIERIVAPVLAAAQARGEIDAAITPHDLVMTVRMIGGLILPFMTGEEVAAQISGASALLLRGLRPR